MSKELIYRQWAMPSRHTFEIKPIAELLDTVLAGRSEILDPFAGRSERGTIRNDLAHGGKDAVDFLDDCIAKGVQADAVLLDPPYSPRQMSECYKSVGLKKGMNGTQNARLYKECKQRLDALLRPGGVAVTCGWNSAGFDAKYGYERIVTLLVSHGGAHNDTIVVVQRKPTPPKPQAAAATATSRP